MFNKRDRRGRQQRRSQGNGYGENFELQWGGETRPAGLPSQHNPGGPDIDQYMYRSIMAMLNNTRRSNGNGCDPDGFGHETESEAGLDSVVLRIEIPSARAQQLRALARDLDESPQTLARMWVMERLRDLSGSTGQKAAPHMLPELPPTATQPTTQEDVIAETKKHLADTYITSPEERAVFDETYTFRQWGPYIAGLVLSTQGRKVFTVDDIKQILRDELMPNIYDTPGARESDISLKDTELGSPGEKVKPFACLERVAPGVYSFIGFGPARAKRAGR
ncbi:MAG TPA: hypothetical protein ENL12_04040 [Dehalococcoidia bacterium]|nr:hypothetical protein [Dehalococcoidia bacterium]